MGLRRRHRRSRRSHRRAPRPDAGRRVLPGRAAELHRERAAAARRGARAGRLVGGRTTANAVLRRIARRSAACGGGPARDRRQARRSRRRHRRQHAGSHGRRAWRRRDRRDVVVLLAGLRRPGHPRSLWPDRSGRARVDRRLRLRRQALRLPRKTEARGSGVARRSTRRRHPECRRRRNGEHRRRGEVGRLARQRRAASRQSTVRATAVRSPALHPVFVGHHGRAEVHRPRRRRDAAAAPQGTSAPLRHPSRRPRLLLHDVRLDDVELARHGAGVGGDRDSLRRVAVPSRRPPAVRFSPTPRA